MKAGSAEVQLSMRMITTTATTKVPARLRYDVTDPYAITLLFDNGAAGTIEWIFARNLLAAGMRAPCGDGDVRIWPAEGRNQVFIQLSSPSGRAVFAAMTGRIGPFLEQTRRLVPYGAESGLLDLDSTLRLLLYPDPTV